MNGHYPPHKVLLYCVSYSQKYIHTLLYISLYRAIYNNYTYSAGMKERCRDGCRTSLLIAGVVLVPNIFHTLLPPCHPYITIHFMEMIFSTCYYYDWDEQSHSFQCEGNELSLLNCHYQLYINCYGIYSEVTCKNCKLKHCCSL